MRKPGQIPVVVVALPFAYQDGIDKYNGIMRYLRESRSDWELLIVRDVLAVGQFCEYMSKGVSGVICGSIGSVGVARSGAYIPAACLDVCRGRRTPMVGLDWPVEELKSRLPRRFSFLNVDSEMIGRLAAQTIMNSGRYASYGFVGAYRGCVWSRNRGAFFARELRRGGIHSVRIFKGDAMSESDSLLAWLVEAARPAAVFAANDCTADFVMKTCMRGGLRVPDDFSVLGVDDDPVFCVHTRPTLSSIHPDFEEMGYLAAKELSRLMSGKANGGRMVVSGNPTVTNRMSTAPCSPSGMMVRRAEEIIARRACQGLNSNAIADELRISRRLLDLRYRQFKGVSVRDDIIHERIKRAKHLLAYSGHSIGTICKMCGYRTESYLGKVFLRRVGVSMGDYRNHNRKDAEHGD